MLGLCVAMQSKLHRFTLPSLYALKFVMEALLLPYLDSCGLGYPDFPIVRQPSGGMTAWIVLNDSWRAFNNSGCSQGCSSERG